MNFKILNTDLLEKFRKELNFSPMQLMNQKANDEDAFFIDYFKFYNSVSSIYSSKIEGEKMDADSYLKYKLMNVSFLPDLTKKIDDLYNAYTELPELELNYENFIKIHQLLSANLLPESERGKVRDNMMVVMDNNDRIVYTACDHFLVPTELNKLFEDIEYLIEEELDEFEIFFFASLIHLVFVNIHPFNDGNGRSARILEKWFLISKFGLNAQSITLEKNYYQNHQLYYKNIQKLGDFYDELDYSKSLDFLLMTVNSLKSQS